MGASLRPMKPWALAMLVVGVSAGKPPLRLRHDGTFSIVQVADVHTGEGEASWGPGVDAKTYAALGALVDVEQPDLVVLSGDMMTGLNVNRNATAYWNRLVAVFDDRDVLHTAILGNHDASRSPEQVGARTKQVRKRIGRSLCSTTLGSVLATHDLVPLTFGLLYRCTSLTFLMGRRSDLRSSCFILTRAAAACPKSFTLIKLRGSMQRSRRDDIASETNLPSQL